MYFNSLLEKSWKNAYEKCGNPDGGVNNKPFESCNILSMLTDRF